MKKYANIRAIGIHPSIRFESCHDYGMSEYQLSRIYDTPGYKESSFYFTRGTEVAGSNPTIIRRKPLMWPSQEGRCEDYDSLLTRLYHFLDVKNLIQYLMCHIVFAQKWQFFYKVFCDQRYHIGIGAKAGAGGF